jgi:dolichol-phosphate mannosyltransferase
VANARIVVLLPTYNEAGNLEPMLAAIRENLPAADILVIDDNSPDGTGQMADVAAAADAHVKVAHRPGKQGLGVAYRFGYRWALDQGYDRIIQLDCDFSHDPKDLPRMAGLLDEHEAVVGSRRVPGGGSDGWPWHRNLISGAGSLYARTILASSVHDLTTGFKGFQAGALRKLDVESLRTDGFGFQIEVTSSLLALGIDVHEMPIRFSDRKVGKSKMSSKIFFEAMMKVWSIRASTRRLARARPDVAR